ncbi:efflux RND transporter periplasmic adaptor subunit [Novipirellula artificiosorum]|nr:HlyD family efflux transporter periplasmic adaptor subunit [Novipirellula artificiosorum]
MSQSVPETDSLPVTSYSASTSHVVGHTASKPLRRREATSRWMLFNFVIPIGIVVAAAGFVIALGSVQPSQRPPADASFAGRMQALMPVRVERIRPLSDFNQQLQMKVDGTVVPFREVALATEVAGRIIFKSDRCEAGSYVNSGDLLMKIDPTDYELEAQRLSRLQEQEYEALGEVDQEMVNTKRLIELAIQDESLQQREVDRFRTMPSGYASEGEIDKAKRALLQATQARMNNENQLDLLRKRRSRLEASERLAEAQLEVAKTNLKRTEIRSPIDGVIVSENAELNSFIARGNPIVTIEDTSKVEVATSLRMDQLYWVLDQTNNAENTTSADDQNSRGYDLPETPAIVEFEISGRDGLTYQWDGRLLSYDGIGLDTNTRTVPVRIVVDNPQRFRRKSKRDEAPQEVTRDSTRPTTLVRGMFVTVKLLIAPRTPMVVIPAQGLKPGNRAWQFLPDDTVLEESAKTASTADGDATEDTSPAQSTPATTTPLTTMDRKLEGFDPLLWQAGRVINRDSIFPVDTLSIEGTEQTLVDPSLNFTKKKWWVCEVQDQSMLAGAYVVVSPVGATGDQPIPARIRRPELADDSTAEANDGAAE